MDHTPLESFFDDNEPDTNEVQEAPETEASAPPRDEHGRFLPKETGDTAEPETEPTAEVPPTNQGLPPETFKGLKEEREKRQRLEAELAELKQQFQAAQQPLEPPQPPPSIWEDEQAAFQAHAQAIAAQTSMNARLDMSEMLASQAHDDFEPMRAKFLEMMQINPTLQQKALAAKHPWEEAYQIAKKAAVLEEVGASNLDELKAKWREEFMAEAAANVPISNNPTIPPSLTTARNVGARSGPSWSGPAAIEDLLR